MDWETDTGARAPQLNHLPLYKAAAINPGELKLFANGKWPVPQPPMCCRT